VLNLSQLATRKPGVNRCSQTLPTWFSVYSASHPAAALQTWVRL